MNFFKKLFRSLEVFYEKYIRKQILIYVKNEAGLEFKVPVYSTEEAACADIYSAEYVTIMPNECKIIKTDLHIEIPRGYRFNVVPRSGMSTKMIIIGNTPATIDSDYRGNIGVIMINLGNEPFIVEKGMRIAQCEVNKVNKMKFKLTDELSTTKRGSGGFGHTGYK